MKLLTPGPWLMRFFSLGKICMNQIHVNKVISDQNNGKTYELHKIPISWIFGYLLKMCMSENCTTEIHRSQGPGVHSNGKQLRL